MSTAVRALWAVLFLSVFAPACGGAASPGAAAGPEKAGASGAGAGAQCLAVAGAKREKKANEPLRITAKHILVKYAGAKAAAESVARTREEACLRAEEALKKLQGGASFAEVVATYSEEKGAATREGSLGSIQRGDVAPAFADAAFELGVAEASQVVESDYGFHVILRVE